ncbi:hypothetical protein K0F50_20955, partial [Bacteroides fragilis]|nr:hypothetical protein [Bacteroides fragilis]
MSDQQQIIDELIDYIDKAVLKHSVSNRHVAEVLSWLNEELKKINTEALKKMFLSKNQRDEAKETITFLKGLLVSDNLASINEQGDAEVQNIIAHIKAKTATLEVTGSANVGTLHSEGNISTGADIWAKGDTH